MAGGTKSSTGGGFLLKIRGPRDFFGGLALIVVAAIAIVTTVGTKVVARWTTVSSSL